MKVDEALLAVRPVVWDDAEWIGFSGTCFVFSLFGGTFGFTAGTCSETRPSGTRTLAFPKGGGVDNAFDIRREVLPRSPSVGDRLVTYGFPKESSKVHYGFEETVPAARAFMRPEWRRLDCFEWQPIEIALKCEVDRRGRTPGTLPAVSFEKMALDLDGMSGAPVFGTDENGDATLAGMLVRGHGEAGRAHFIDAEDLAIQAFRVAAKQPAIRSRIGRWLRNADPEHIFARVAALHERLAEFAAMNGHRPRHTGDVPGAARLAFLHVMEMARADPDSVPSEEPKYPIEHYEPLAEALFAEPTPPVPGSHTAIRFDDFGAAERRDRNRRKRERRARRA